MLLSHHLNTGQDHDITVANRSFENVSKFKYMGMTVTNQNLIQEEIKSRLYSGNALLPFSPEPFVFSSVI
jgi:hypothetical protein